MLEALRHLVSLQKFRPIMWKRTLIKCILRNVCPTEINKKKLWHVGEEKNWDLNLSRLSFGIIHGSRVVTCLFYDFISYRDAASFSRYVSIFEGDRTAPRIECFSPAIRWDVHVADLPYTSLSRGHELSNSIYIQMKYCCATLFGPYVHKYVTLRKSGFLIYHANESYSIISYNLVTKLFCRVLLKSLRIQFIHT